MRDMNAMVRAATLQGYPALVRELGGKPEALLRKRRIDPTILEDENALISFAASTQLLEDTANKLGCADFGLRLAAVQGMEVLGPLAVAMQNARTPIDAMLCGSRYLYVHCPAMRFSVLERSPQRPKLTELRYEISLPGQPLTRQALDKGLAIAHLSLKALARTHYRLEELHLSHTPRAPDSVYTRYFGVRPRCAQPHCALLLRPEVLQTPIHAINASLREMALDYLDVRFPNPGQSLTERVSQVISRSLGTGLGSKEEVADMLAMHPRTLQRNLAAEGTSFDAIREEIRRNTALRYLRTTRMPLAQVAGLVGLSEQSALTRACKRWFGTTPSTIRRRESSV